MQHLDVPFERLIVPHAVDAIPLKLAYSNPKETTPVVPSAQAIYGASPENKDNVSFKEEKNVWFIAITCITVLVVILLISYYIVSTLRKTGGLAIGDIEDDEYERD